MLAGVYYGNWKIGLIFGWFLLLPFVQRCQCFPIWTVERPVPSSSTDHLPWIYRRLFLFYPYARRKSHRGSLGEHSVGQTADVGTVNKSEITVPAENWTKIPRSSVWPGHYTDRAILDSLLLFPANIAKFMFLFSFCIVIRETHS